MAKEETPTGGICSDGSGEDLATAEEDAVSMAAEELREARCEIAPLPCSLSTQTVAGQHAKTLSMVVAMPVYSIRDHLMITYKPNLSFSFAR